MINPHLLYGILVWGFDNGRLFKLQKRAIRIINKAEYNAHTEPLFKSSKILKIADMFSLSCLKFLYKYFKGNLPAHFNNLTLVEQAGIHTYDTRLNQRFRINITRTQRAQNSIRNYLPKFANSLPNCIYDKLFTHSLQGLSNYTKHQYIAEYTSVCRDYHCFVCHGTRQ